MGKPGHIRPVFQAGVGLASTLLVLGVTFVLAAGAVALAGSCNLVENPGFEELPPEGGMPAGWTWSLPAGADPAAVGISSEMVHSGSYSLRLTDNSDKGSLLVYGKRFPAKAGVVYTASAWCYNAQGGAHFYLEFRSESGERIGVKFAGSTDTGKWARITLRAVAPDGTAYVNVLLYSPMGNVGTSYFDDIELIEGDVLNNPSFEEVTGGFPVAWEVFGGNVKVEASQEVVRSGRHSARIVDESTTIGMGLRSFPVVVTPGKEYVASVYSYNVQGMSQLYLEFWDASGNRIKVYIGNNSTSGAWNEIRVTGAAPEGSAYATLLMYSHNANVGTLYFDDAALEAKPEPSNVSLIVGDRR